MKGGSVPIKDRERAQQVLSGPRRVRQGDRELLPGEAKIDKGEKMMVQESQWQIASHLGFSLQKHRGRKNVKIPVTITIVILVCYDMQLLRILQL